MMHHIRDAAPGRRGREGLHCTPMPGRGPLAFLLALWMLALSTVAPAQALPTAIAGRLVLHEVPREPVSLRGEWGFAWHRYLDPDWQQLPTQALAPVPSVWNDIVADGKPRGSLLILDVADRAEAEAFAAGDPYAKAGLFESAVIRPFRQVYRDGEKIG